MADPGTSAETIFNEAADLPAQERAPFLVRRCGGDEALRAEVESLLRFADAEDATLLDRAQAPIALPRIPERLGPYRIVRVIGEGGMGVVYEAVQESPRRTVALKVLRSPLATPSLVRRFEHEAEVLGQLKHPGIAQVYQAGSIETAFGPQPYFAMELVSGQPLSAYAQAGLTLRAKLELVARVCDAVHHAHQKGVIHRDLKPANILVGEDGQPKVLDFGVARVTDADVRTVTRTEAGQLVGTLPYMSPEQVSGDPAAVDTRSDVHALGVILYEVLTGALPYRLGTSIAEGARIIREAEPRPLTSISHAFRGDVSTITSKALQKEKDRRYQSAAELAADLRRFLHDEPIAARPPTAMYQLRKFARRNRALVGGAGATVGALVLGIIAATGFALRAHRSETEARGYAYRAGLAAASADLASANGDSARQRLALIPESRRGWEWEYLRWLSDQSVATLDLGGAQGAEGAPGQIAWAVLGGRQVLIICTADGGLRVWDPFAPGGGADAGPAFERLEGAGGASGATGGGPGPPMRLAVSPDNAVCIARYRSGVTAAWSLETGRVLWREPLALQMGPDPFSADSRLAVFGVDGQLRATVRDARTGEERRSISFYEFGMGDLHFVPGPAPGQREGGPAEARVVLTSNLETVVYDPAARAAGARFPLARLVFIEPSPPPGLDPGGAPGPTPRLIVGPINDGSLGVFDLDSGRELLRQREAMRPRALVAVARGGGGPGLGLGLRAAVSDAHGTITLYELRPAAPGGVGGGPERQLHGHGAFLEAMDFSRAPEAGEGGGARGGRWLASLDHLGVVKVWDALTGAPGAGVGGGSGGIGGGAGGVGGGAARRTGSGDDMASRVVLSPDRSLAVSMGWGAVHAWETGTGAPRWTAMAWRHTAAPAVAFSPDSTRLALAASQWGGEVALLATGIRGTGGTPGGGTILWRRAELSVPVVGVGWSADGSGLAVFSADGSAELRAAADGALVQRVAGAGGGGTGGPAGGGMVFATEERGGRALVRCGAPGEGGGEGLTCEVWAIGPASAGGLRALGGWRTPGAVMAAAFGADGTRLAVSWAETAGGRTGGSVIALYDCRAPSPSGWRLIARGGCGARVGSLSISDEHERILACCEDETIRVLGSLGRTEAAGSGPRRLAPLGGGGALEELLLLPAPGGRGVAALTARGDLVAGTSAWPVLAYDLAPPPDLVAEQRAWREARERTDALRRSGLMLVKDQVAALEADAGLEPRARERAIATARRVGDQLNAINSWVWGRVEYAPRGQPPESYVPELRLAEEVCRQWEHRSFVNTLGVAQLRAGRTAEAYESLRRSMALRQRAMPGAGEDLYDTVYLAIAAHRLGREDEARRYRDLTLQLAPRELGNDEQGTIVREMLEELGG